MGALRLVIVLVAAAAAAVALALVARHLTATHASKAMAATPPPRPQVRVLVAKRDLKIGDRLVADDVTWQAWPVSAASRNFINGGPVKAGLVDQAQAVFAGDPQIVAVTGSLVLEPVAAKEPMSLTKLVKGGQGGFMAVKLPSGMRAMTMPVSVESGAGGFILPGDHVDVIEDIKLASSGGQGAGQPAQPIKSQTILKNITVLAIDQAPEPKPGASTLVGASATLEIPQADIDLLAKAREEGTLQLALRSHADMDGPQGAVADNTPTVRSAPVRYSAPIRYSALPSEEISVRIYRGAKVSEVKVP
jgi:pilus assembly protein CpaB